MSLTNITTHETWGHVLKESATRNSVVEAIGGFAAVVLSIIGLGGAAQSDMASISAILIGASLLLECGTQTANYRKRVFQEEGKSAQSSGFEGLMTVEFMAGIAGILLGILALIGVATWILVSVATIVLGCAFLLNSGNMMRMQSQWTSDDREVTGIATSAEIGAHMIIGLGAIVLGILGVLNIVPAVLNLVAYLALGVSVLLSRSFFGVTRMMQTKPA